MVIGRDRECAAIDGLLGQAGAGSGGGGLVLSGEPGIGKSALLDYAAERAAGFRVLRTAGVEAESALAYASLHRLLRPVLGSAERLPAPQAQALRTAFGFEAGPPPERFLVSVATLTLLSEVVGERPVLCLVDDAHWADLASQEVLTFVARRLDAEAVAMVLALREGEGRRVDTAGLETLLVSGLDVASAGTLLDARWGAYLAPAVRDRLALATGGNPLALIELTGTLTGWQLAGRDPLPDLLPLAGELERVFLERVRAREPSARRLLLLAAAEGAGQLAVIRRAAGKLGLDAGLLESPQLADLVGIDGSAVAFHHPLVRAAAYQGACPAARREAHRALAEALRDGESVADRRAWHLAQAAEGPDEEVAAELERVAERTRRRSGHAAAAAALERAADLSREEEDRARRLVAAADAAWVGGDTARARGLLDRAERLGPRQARTRLDLTSSRAAIELRTGVPADALALLLPAAREAVEVDPHLAARMLMAAGEATVLSNQPGAMREIGSLFGRLHAARGEDAFLERLHLSVALAARRGDPERLRADLTRVEELDDPGLLVWAGGMAWGLGNYRLARHLRARAVARCRAFGAAGTLAWALEYLVMDELFGGRFASAEAYADEGRRLALETGRANSACQQLGVLATLAALRGREEEARRMAHEALAEATERRLVVAAAAAHRALAELALTSGRTEEAFEHLEALWASGPMPRRHGIAANAVPDLVEAAARAGRPQRCREPLAEFLAWADEAGSTEARALAARARALLASSEEADRWFQEALRRHAETDRPMDTARTRLLYGEFLRRHRRRLMARPHLRAALDVFERLGTPAWAERARGELRATGETARRRDPSSLDQLTPQELQILRAVGEGATNREVGAQLFISPRTVDYHLRKVFNKLGISSRAELIRIAASVDAPP